MRPYRAGRCRSAIHRGTLLAALLLTGSLWIGVSSACAEVGISKSASATVSHVDENVHFTLTLTNTGALPATATVRDTLPPNFVYVSVISAIITECTQAPVGTLTCQVALPASQSGTVVIVAAGTSPGPWSNQASVTSATVTTSSNIVSGVILPRDIDGDGVADELDNCPADANPDQANTDGDAQGDACDADDDNDNVVDTADNCQFTANPGQQDFDGDGVGSACDAEELPTDKDQCKNGGWRLFYDLDGPRFGNQGDCVSFVQRGPK